MTINKEGAPMDIYDFVPAHAIDEGDQVAYENDYVEVSSKVDSGDAIMVKGYSHISGDNVFYIIPSETEVGLWMV